MRRAVENNLIRLLILAALIGAWQGAVSTGLLPEFEASSPSAVWNALVQQIGNGTLLTDIGVTLKEAALGFLLGIAVGVPLGFAFATFPRVGDILEPFITMLNALPRLALAPLYLLWFGFGSGSHIALVFSIVVFIMLVNTIEGARSQDPDIMTLSLILGATRMQTIRKVMLPATAPWIVAGMRLSTAYALSGAVVGEMFSGNGGIGHTIVAASGFFDLGVVFAGIVMIMLVAWLFDLLGKQIERRALHWRVPGV
jgi:NitT/TauT family transport system permease protein